MCRPFRASGSNASPESPPFRSETAWEDATFSAGLFRAYNPAAYDAVITCSFPFTHWTLGRGIASKPLRIFVTQNGDWPAYDDRYEFRTFRCDGLVCTNPDYLERNRERWDCALIPNGIDLARFGPGASERERLGLPQDRPIVLMVSAFIDSKRVLAGIRAVAEIEDAFLVIAGDGPLRAAGQALADELMPGRYLRISLPAHEMPALYRSADAFLHLSLFESFGNVFLEAWASGLPVVAHDTQRLRWILGSTSKYLCDTEDHAALVQTLRSALQSRPELQRRAEGIERFAWSVIGGQYRVFLERLLAQRGQADSSRK